MAAPFHEVRFPESVSSGAQAVVRSKTAVFTTGGGRERRSRRWSNQLRVWDVTRGIKYTSDLEVVRAFHIVMDGSHAGFRFKDFSDHTATDQLVDTSGGGSTFQLRRGYTAGDVTKWRKITKPVPGTTVLTLNGEIVVVLEDGQSIEEWSPLFGEVEFGFNPETAPRFALDTTTGLLTSVIPGTLSGADTLYASYEFDVPARFGSDEFKVRAKARGKIWEYEPILIRELRQ